MSITRRFLLCITLSSLPCSVSAQEEMKTRVQFVCFPSMPGQDPVELLGGDGQVIPIELPSNRLSDTYNVVTPRNWVLGNRKLGPDGKATFDVYGKVEALASKAQIILVTRKGTDIADGFNMTPFATDDDGLGGGKYLVFNAANVDIACELGTSKFKLGPNRHTLVSPEPSKVKNDRKYLFTRIYYRLGEDAKPFYESTWRFSEEARSLVFVYHDEYTRQLRTHTIRSFTR